MNRNIRWLRFFNAAMGALLMGVSQLVNAGDACLLSGTDAEQGLWWTESGTNIFRGKITHSGNPITIRIQSTFDNIRFWPGNTLRTQFTTTSPFALKTSGGSWGALSDYRVKKDIRTFTRGLPELMQVQPRIFKYNGKAVLAPDDGRDYIGVVAQELQPIVPSMVSTLADVSVDGRQLLTVDPSDFIYMLTNAVQEQNTQLQTLKAKTALLEKLTCIKHPEMNFCRGASNRRNDQ